MYDEINEYLDLDESENNKHKLYKRFLEYYYEGEKWEEED